MNSSRPAETGSRNEAGSDYQDLEHILEEICVRFRHRCGEVGEALEESRRRLDSASTSAEKSDCLFEVSSHAHGIAGAAGTFGFVELGESALDLETTISDLDPIPNNLDHVTAKIDTFVSLLMAAKLKP